MQSRRFQTASNRHHVCLAIILLFTATFLPAMLAAEKGGLMVDIQKTTVGRKDAVTLAGIGNMSVDRTMSLKLTMKNTSRKDMPETTLDYVILVQRWSYETGQVERFEGTVPVPTLPFSRTTSLKVGEYHIGGHMHGTSEMHVDRLVAWKITINREGEKLEFTSGSNFESLNKRAASDSAK